MKKINLIPLIPMFIFGFQFFKPLNVSAQCKDISSLGAVKYNLSTVSKDNDSVIWVRLMHESTEYSLYTEINDKDCFEIKSYQSKPNEWSWQAARVNNKPIKTSFGSESGNYIKLIGLQNGLKVDKILISENNCIPVNDGSNCLEENFVDEGGLSYFKLPTQNSVLSGEVTISDTPQKNLEKLKSVIYVSQGKQLLKTNNSTVFDTTLLPNGKHNIYITTELNDGDVIRELATINIQNDENAITPIIRWVKLNRVISSVILIIFILILVSIIVLNILRIRYKKRRENKFRGLGF